MATKNSLLEKRDQIKRRLATAERATLIVTVLDGTSRLVQKITRSSKPASYWYSALVIPLLILLIGVLISSLLDEFDLDFTLLMALAAGLVFLGVIIFKAHRNILIAGLREHVVDAIESEENLVDLQRWLNADGNRKAAGLFGLAFGITSGALTSLLFSVSGGRFFGIGLTVTATLLMIMYGVGFYNVLLYFVLPTRLSRYQFRLYMADPSSSELVSQLSGMFMAFVYLLGFLTALVTLFGVAFGVLSSSYFVLIMAFAWGLIIASFVVTQYALSRIITTAKYKTLNEIQARVEQLHTNANLADKETMEAVNRLMDYHDRIRATRNSALNLRAGLNFLNSLLLPLLAFILANLDKILALFQ